MVIRWTRWDLNIDNNLLLPCLLHATCTRTGFIEMSSTRILDIIGVLEQRCAEGAQKELP